MAYQEAQKSEQNDTSRKRKNVDGVDLRLLEWNVKKLEEKVREMRRLFIDVIPTLTQPHNGRRLHPLTQRRLTGIRSLPHFFEEIEQYVDLETGLEEDFETLQRYRKLHADLQEMRRITRRKIERVTESQEPDHQPSAQILPLRLVPIRQEIADIKLKFTRPREELGNLSELSIRTLRVKLKATMRSLKAHLAEQLEAPDIDELMHIKNPASFLRAIETRGVNLREAIGDSHMAELEIYESKKAEKLLRREAKKITHSTTKRNRRIDRSISKSEPKTLREGSRRDQAIDELVLQEEKEAMPAGNHHPNARIPHDNSDNGKNGAYSKFLQFWNQMRQIKPLTLQEEHDLFEAYENGKINILNRLSYERHVMRAILALCVPRHLYKTFSDNSSSWYGFQFFTSYTPGFEEFDPFKLLHGEEHRVDNTLARWLELEVKSSEMIAESGAEEVDEDDEIIDFATKWHEICRFIRQHGILYLKEFHKIENILAKLKFGTQTVQKKGEDHYKEKTDSVSNALQIFIQSPSEKTLLQSIEYLWTEASQAESNPETLRDLLESFFEELKKIGVTVPNSNIPKAIQARLQAAEDPRRSIIDLFMKIRPNPDLLKALGHFSSNEDALLESIETLLKMKQRILAPHLRNVCFGARFFIRRGAVPDVCIEAGTLGLMRAADVFDYRVGQRFYKYCWRHINDAINRGNWTENNQIHIPNHQHESIERVQKAAKLSALQFGDESPEHIAELAKMTEEDVKEAMGHIRLNHTRSYETPDRASDDGDVRSLQDSLATATTETPEDILIQGELLRANLERILSKAGLDLQEEDILRRRYFDANDRNETLEQIGTTRSVTKERIRQIEVKALIKLREYMKQKGLSAESFV